MGRSILMWLLPALVIAGIGSLFFLVLAEKGSGKSQSSSVAALDTPIAIQGLVYSDYADGKLLNRVQADQLTVNARKFSVFRVKSMNQVVLANPRFEIFSDERATAQDEADAEFGNQLAAGMQGLCDLKGIGRITRSLLFNLRITCIRSGAPFFMLTAAEGEMDLQEQQLRLKDVVIENPANHGKIMASQAKWDGKTKVFFIPAGYGAEPNLPFSKDKAITVGLDFKIQSVSNQ